MTIQIPEPKLEQARETRASRANASLLRSSLRLLGCIAAIALGAMSVRAATIVVVNDTWKDSTRTDPAQPVYSEIGTDADADGDIESVWYRSGTGSSTTMSSNHMVHTAGAASSMSLTTYFQTNNQAIALNNVGDSLKLTWVFKPNGLTTTATGNNDMRIAIVDSPARVTSDATPPSAVYSGYGLAMNMRTGTLGNNSSLRSMEWAVSGGANNILSTAAAWAANATAPSVAGTTPGYTEGNTYTLVWQITRTVGGADIYQGITDSGGTLGSNGVLEVTFSDPTPQPLVFDTFSLRPSTPEVTATNFDTTLFKVEFTPAGCAPTPFNVTGSTNVCPGGTSPVGLSGSQVNVDYHLLLGGSPVGSPVAGTGSALNFGLQSAGTYTVYASNTTIACEGLMVGSAVIAEYASPLVTVNPSPVDATNAVGGTRVFSITATGASRAYQWRKNGTNLTNSGNISGVTTNSLTISSLTTNDSGSYDCLVSNTICGSEAISAAANLTVIDIPGDLFRSVTSGLWEDLATWEQSTNGGGSWFAATQIPSDLSSNITVINGHTVTVNADATVDQVTIQAGGTVSVANGNLTINNGAAATDFTVAGTLQVEGGAGLINVGTATLNFASGGVFDWIRPGIAPAIPTATWQDGSTCRVSATSGSNAFATGFSGQSYYDFVYDTTAQGQSARCRLDLQGTATEVRRDFSITLPDTHNASVTINNAANSILTVGRHVTFTTGTSTNSNKVLFNNAAVTGFNLKVGGNFTCTGFLDGFGGSSTLVEFNGVGTQTLTLPVEPFILTSGAMNWVVNNGSTVQLGNTLDGFQTFTNKGTFNFGSYTIVRGTTLVFDASGTVIGNSTNRLTITNGVVGLNTIQVGGNLNLPGLPTFVGGENFLLFEAATHTGTFATITPATPGVGLVWNTTQLGTAGILAVTTPGGPATNPTNIVSSVSGGNLTLSWPPDHLGWTLQTQTNSRSVGLVPATNAWFDVAGSTSVTNVVIPLNSTDPTVFYRLRLFMP